MANSSGSQNKTTQGGKAVLAKSAKKKKMKPWGILLIVFAVVALVGVAVYGAYHGILDYYLNKINIVTEEEDLIFATELIEPDEMITQDGPSQTIENAYNESELPLICDTENVKNILLIGADARGNEAGLSDSLILVSINSETKQIVMCSFLRDIWAKYPQEPSSLVSGGYDKLTHAHSYGGPALTIAVLKETFNIDVDHYVKVNFNSFVKLVDMMGGLSLYLTAGEVEFINLVLVSPEFATIFPDREKTQLPVQDGVVRLNGMQTLAHARNRNIGSDWARTERQRNIITQMMSQVKGLSLTQLNNLLDTALPLVTTNMSKSTLKELVGNALSYLNYEIVSTRIPQNGTYTEENYNIIPDLEVNCNDLYEKIYGTAPEKK